MHIHTLLNSPLPTNCRSLPKALIRNQKQPYPSLPEYHRASLIWKEATPSLTLRVTWGNSSKSLPKPQFI